MHYYPEEPFIDELKGKDTLEFPPPPEVPREDDAVIPPRVMDELLNDPDEVAMDSIRQVWRKPLVKGQKLVSS